MKKFTSAVLAFAMLISAMVCGASAADAPADDFRIIVDGYDITVDTEEEISRALLGITDLESAPAEVSVTPMDGCDVEVYTTTREIKLPEESSFSVMSDGEPDSKIYATTSVAVLSAEKESSDQETKWNITTTATIYWRDNFGMLNDFLGASGEWIPHEDPDTWQYPTMTNRKVQLEADFDAGNRYRENFNMSSNSWRIRKSEFDCTAWVFFARMSINVGGFSKPFEFTVQTSALD